MANIREVAKLAGVSVATVSRVLNHPERVSDKTRKKIDKIIEQIGFSPNVFARGLNFNRSNTIALIIPDIKNPVYTEIARGVENIAHKKGYNLLLCNTEKDLKKERRYVKMLIDKKIDGVILAHTVLPPEEVKEITNENVKLLLFGFNIINENISSVYSNFKEGAKLAINHLINLGYKNIAYIAGSENHSENRDKTQGFLEAMKEHNIPVHSKHIVQGNDDIDSGYLAALRLSKSEILPDAVFASNDLMAIGAISALKNEGLRVPEDVAIIGYDNIDMADLVEPKLTTVAWPVYKMGVIATRILLEEIESTDEENMAQNIFLHPKLKIRKSCGHEDRVSEIF
ncbi:MAG: LacI family transcriptional regulator [Spirochaetes bacterium]|nr:LacI family transcriptional regulator [Spirochaetota bacterium]